MSSAPDFEELSRRAPSLPEPGNSVHSLAKRALGLARASIRRPLSIGELSVELALMLVLGTAYCAIYCRIAFYPMHEGSMPLWLSAWWAATCLLPWLVAFEVVKRLAPRAPSRLARIAGFLLIAAITAALTVTAQRVSDVDMMGMGKAVWPTVLANQMLPILLFAALVVLRSMGHSGDSAARPGSELSLEPLPALSSIEWIRAAGNYVEVKCGERLLIRRMTMRMAEEATRSADFIRIHRSVIVRKRAIVAFVGPRRSRVSLSSGEVMPVGDSYRPAVERLVP